MYKDSVFEFKRQDTILQKENGKVFSLKTFIFTKKSLLSVPPNVCKVSFLFKYYQNAFFPTTNTLQNLKTTIPQLPTTDKSTKNTQKPPPNCLPKQNSTNKKDVCVQKSVVYSTEFSTMVSSIGLFETGRKREGRDKFRNNCERTVSN